jgi:hypothetical protein
MCVVRCSKDEIDRRYQEAKEKAQQQEEQRMAKYVSYTSYSCAVTTYRKCVSYVRTLFAYTVASWLLWPITGCLLTVLLGKLGSFAP